MGDSSPKDFGKTTRYFAEIVIRYSGTEPLLRIMVEAESEELIDRVIEKIVEAVKEDGIVE